MTKLLFTGASGFLGKNTLPILREKYIVETLGLTKEESISCNLVTEVPQLVKKYDIILHAAGKAHSIPKTEAEKKVFFDVNYEGTKNLCKGLEKVGVPRSFIFVSTVAVYGCDTGELIDEDYPLKGESSYALSKIYAERFLQDWAAKNGVILSIIRPSLIAGPNPPGNLGAMIRGIKTHRYLSIAGGKAKKSVLMVQDIANLIPLLAEKGGIYNVCDSHHPTFRELEELIAEQLGKRIPVNIPLWFAYFLGKIGDCMGRYAPLNSSRLEKIVKSLTFSNAKIKRELKWEPMPVVKHFKIEE